MDRKWEELSNFLKGESDVSAAKELFDSQGHRHKLIIFTEHRDTLRYLTRRIQTLIENTEAIVTIHGSMRSEHRQKVQEAFMQDPKVQILVATDAAGEGINLQQAHLMVNYDLPWNPNRIEQRFGRIHRIGQMEVCNLWNLVASKTREGEVFNTLLYKLGQQREALGGAVFDVLGKCFTDTSLRTLLIEAIREGDKPEVKERLTKVIDGVINQNHLRALIDENALTHGIIDTTRLGNIREEMERAEARRLQPHFIASFFHKAFVKLGGKLQKCESGRYEVIYVPPAIRNHRLNTRQPILHQYERITFEKDRVNIPGKPLATFVCPGHPLLDATLRTLLENHRNLLRQGTVLVDENEQSNEVRVLFYLEHAIQDGREDNNGRQQVISQRMQFVEINRNKTVSTPGYAPYLDYRPITGNEWGQVESLLEAYWLSEDLESEVKDYAVEHLVPVHLNEVKTHKEDLVYKTMKAVEERLYKEINHWMGRALDLDLQEAAGRPMANLNAAQARQRANDLEDRLERRMEELEQELYISPIEPVVIGGALIVPQSLLDGSGSESSEPFEISQVDRDRIDRLAVDAVMAAERKLGREPTEMSHQNPGYDIESKDPNTNLLLFIEVKGKAVGSTGVTVSKTQILTAFNKPDNFILAIVEINGETVEKIYYIPRPFQKERDFEVTSVTYSLDKLLERATSPS